MNNNLFKFKLACSSKELTVKHWSNIHLKETLKLLKVIFYLLMASFDWLSNIFLLLLGFDIKLDLNPHFLTISRIIETLSIILEGSE